MQRRTSADRNKDESAFFRFNDKVIDNISTYRGERDDSPPWGIIRAKKRQKEEEEEYRRQERERINNMFK